MRGKRSKQYRKLMHQYQLAFNFREPYQILVDADTVKDAARFSMPLAPALERTIQGKVKPMITQCSIRHLYTAEGMDQAQKNACIDTAKTFERRRCNHHTLEQPLSEQECITSVLDPKSSGTNKHRYVVASQDRKLRSALRDIPGVPLIYINRSVMIMEPMGHKTEEARDQEERGKVRAGLKGRRGPLSEETPLKRKRDDNDDDDQDNDGNSRPEPDAAPKKRRKGPKGPNPLSVKKSKKKSTDADIEAEKQVIAKTANQDPQAAEKTLAPSVAAVTHPDGDSEAPAKKKRRRKHKSATESSMGVDSGVDTTPTLIAEA